MGLFFFFSPNIWPHYKANNLAHSRSKLLLIVLTVGESDRPTGKLCGEVRRPADAWIHALPVSPDVAAGGAADAPRL